jgi:hypothetical protein
MARGDFPHRHCKVILVEWWVVIFFTNRSYHEDSSPQPRDCARNWYSYRSCRHGQIVCCADHGVSIKASVPALTTDVRYRARRDYPYPSYSGYPTYNSYWGNYRTYNSYWSYPTYDYPGFSYGWW